MRTQPPPPFRLDDFSVDLAGGPIAVRRICPTRESAGDGPTLVFLHEALGCIAMWRDVPAQLSHVTGLAALAYDRHGHGRSGALAGPRGPVYLDREALEILPAVLAAAGIADPLLIGHSDGGSIALLFASQYPVRAVVTEAAHVFVEDITRDGIRAALAAWRDTDLRDRLAGYHGDKTEALFYAWADTWLSDEFATWNIEACLPHITSPVLAIQGEDDEYGTVRQVNAIVGGVSGRVRSIILPDCRHSPHVQAEDRLLPLIEAFVTDCLG